MVSKSCANCRRSRRLNGAMYCEERRSSAIGGVIVLDVDEARRVASFERICTLVAAPCAFFQIVG